MTSNYVEILVRARDQGAKPEMDDLRVKLNDLSGRVAEARALVDDEAAAAKLDDLQAKLLRLDKTTARPKITMDQAIRAESQVHALEAVFTDFGNKADAAAKKADKGLDDVEKKAKDTGKQAAAGLSPLLIGAFAAAATVGPGLLLAATGAAVIGVGALVTKSNVQLSASYNKLGNDAADAITAATAPLVPALKASVDVLDQGIGRVEPQLANLFSAAAPQAVQLATGISNLAGNALPGMTAALKAAAPYSREFATDLGDLGTGVSNLFAGLGKGAGGGATGLNALITTTEHLLTDIGQIIGALSNGLGPALGDISKVAIPVADGLAKFVSVIPPQTIRAAADATAALFLAFKTASLAGLLTEGATFLTFLRGEAVAAGEATAATGMLARAQAGATAATGTLSAATGAAAGPWGVLSAALLLGENQLSKLTGLTLDPITAFNQLKEAETAHVVAAAKAATAIGSTGDALRGYAKMLNGSTTSTNALSSALSSSATAAQQSAQQTAAKTLADLGARDGSNLLTLALQGQITAFENATTETSAFKTVMEATFGKYQSYSDAVATFTTDLASANGQLTRGKNAIDLHSAAGAKNYTILSGLATQNEAVAEALLKQTGDQNQANKALQSGAIQIDNLAKKAGFSASQIAQLNEDLYGTAKIGDIKVSVSADTSRVYEGVSGALHWIDSTSATIPVNVAGPARAGFAHGGIVGAAATGGPRGNLTMINEQGPELVRLPSGSMVMSHPDSMRTAAEAGGGGWDGTVRLVWDGPAATDGLFQLIRQHVRAVAGTGPDSVQTALGQH